MKEEILIHFKRRICGIILKDRLKNSVIWDRSELKEMIVIRIDIGMLNLVVRTCKTRESRFVKGKKDIPKEFTWCCSQKL